MPAAKCSIWLVHGHTFRTALSMPAKIPAYLLNLIKRTERFPHRMTWASVFQAYALIPKITPIPASDARWKRRSALPHHNPSPQLVLETMDLETWVLLSLVGSRVAHTNESSLYYVIPDCTVRYMTNKETEQ